MYGKAPLILLALLPACAGYTSALGFRARQAVLKSDVEVFQELMAEAADTTPKGPRDNPKKTVLTHFLDLAGDPRFFPYIEGWRKNGWVDADMICSIHRAHFRAVKDSDPAAARSSAEACLFHARNASQAAELSWQVTDCLDEAAFLTQSSTQALLPFVERAADAAEPLKFRVALLDGMTHLPSRATELLPESGARVPKEQSFALAEAELARSTRRQDWILESVRAFLETTLLAGGTGRGAMELEQAHQNLGKSYLARYAESPRPDDQDLAWAWARAIKAKKKIPELASLGLWARSREPQEDAFWYVCVQPAREVPGPGSLGPVLSVEAITVREPHKVEDPQALRAAKCGEGGAPYPRILGPYPLESTARARAGQEAQERAGTRQRSTVLLKRRVLPEAAPAAEE